MMLIESISLMTTRWVLLHWENEFQIHPNTLNILGALYEEYILCDHVFFNSICLW